MTFTTYAVMGHKLTAAKVRCNTSELWLVYELQVHVLMLQLPAFKMYELGWCDNSRYYLIAQAEGDCIYIKLRLLLYHLDVYTCIRALKPDKIYNT